MKTTHSHLRGLDSLRWYSAFAVIITHVELHKGYHGLENVWQSRWVQNLGPAGVYFFFTLSGFLVTWLLAGKGKKPEADLLPSFYRRRAFRILPLYYFMVLLGFFVLPSFEVFQYPDGATPRVFSSEFVAFASAQPHVASAYLGRAQNISHLWSIGVELSFYVIWPFLLISSRNLPRSIVRFVLAVLLIKASLFLVAPRLLEHPQQIFHLAATLKFECMAIGSWFATESRSSLQKLLLHPLSVWVAAALVPLVFLFYGTALDDICHLPLSILFGVIIRNAAFGQSSPIQLLDNRVTQYLGQISYGVYCYHVLFITATLNLMQFSAMDGPRNLILYTMVISSTIVCSALSFHFLEQPLTRYGRRQEQRVTRQSTVAPPTVADGYALKRAA